ncbi:unnamed protein product [Urochloa decumbens]|uniref:Uncharacterized protein n=1 Tax=Urochloa decumbens TaxID=240449 RepID=A0ABC8VQP1_9POAL
MQAARHGPAAGGGGGLGGVAAAGPTTVDEASMERSKSFIKALQELKNLRPQLYSASEYCEKSYLHSEQKQMVLDNLKDYAQASEVSTFELKVARLNQQILTCQVYTDKEGLRQQQMMGTNIKHHKHYILPSTGHKRSPAHARLPTDTDQESKPRPYPSAKTLSWHLASDNSTTANAAHKPTFALVDTASSKPASGKERSASPMRRPMQFNRSTSSDAMQKIGTKTQSGVKEFSTFHSFDDPKGRAIQKAPVGTKSMLAALFIKHKSAKMKKIAVR